jgi:CheY-like chemotaxis protein
MDIGLPGMSGIAGIRELKVRHPNPSVLMLTVYDDDTRIFPPKYSDRSAIIEVDQLSFAPSVSATTPVQRARCAGLNV